MAGFMGGLYDKHEPNGDARKNAYNADITYGTNNEFGFDYLRDNMVQSRWNGTAQTPFRHGGWGGQCIDWWCPYAADHQRPVGHSDNTSSFLNWNPVSKNWWHSARQWTSSHEAKKKLPEGNDDPKDGGLRLMRAHRGLPRTAHWSNSWAIR